MLNESVEIDIERPLHEVAEYAVNPDNVHNWYQNVQSVQWKTSPPLVKGSELSFVSTLLGRDTFYTYAVTEYRAGQKFVMRTTEGPLPMETSYIWEAMSDGSTRMTMQNQGIPAGFSKWMLPLMALNMRKAMQEDLNRLKNILEKRNQE